MAFEKELPVLREAGSELPESIKNNGWNPDEGLAAQHLNNMFHKTYNALDELQKKAAEKDEVNQQLAQMKEKLSGTIFVDAFAHLKNGDDWSPALQYIADNLGQAEIVLPNERIELQAQTIFRTSKFKLRSQANTKIVNMTNEQVNTGVALFYLQGNKVELGATVSTKVEIGSNVVTVSDVSVFSVGDYLGFEGYYSTFNMSVVERVDLVNKTITLDRQTYYPILQGAKIYKINAIEDVEISDLDIDFNGQYGYGVFVSHGRNVTTKRIKGLNFGSKVVQYNNSFDCLSEDIHGSRGINNVQGGHCYVVRYAVCNDCVAVRVIGRNARHSVDFSGACRNTVYNAEGYFNTSADFMTHGNHCYDNLFVDCKSVGNSVGAYSFNPNDTGSSDPDNPGFDRNNIVQGGTVIGSAVVYHPQDGSNIFKGLTIKTTLPYAIRRGGKLTFENCTFIVDSALITIGSNDWDLTFVNCRFIINVASGLGNMTNATSTVDVTFDNCDIDINTEGTVLLMPTNGTLTLKNCNVKLANSSQNLPAFVSKGKILALGGMYAFKNQGVSIFGLQAGAHLTLDKCHIAKASEIIRPYTIATAHLKLGSNTLDNATYINLNTMASVETIGVIDIGATSIPTSDKFKIGSRILNNAAEVGAADVWAYTSTGWKVTSLIS